MRRGRSSSRKHHLHRPTLVQDFCRGRSKFEVSSVSLCPSRAALSSTNARDNVGEKRVRLKEGFALNWGVAGKDMSSGLPAHASALAFHGSWL